MGLKAIAKTFVTTLRSFSSTNVPATPTAGMKLFARFRAGRTNLAGLNPSGLVHEYQTDFGKRKVAYILPAGGGSATVGVVGCTVAVTTGTATAVAVTSATPLGDFSRVTYVSAGSAAASAGVVSSRGMTRGSAAGCGGFEWVCRFSLDTNTAAGALFVGLANPITDLGDVDPSSLTNIFGVGCDAADSNLQLMTNDGSGTATKTDLGANFPGKTDGAIYELRISTDTNGSAFYWSLQRLDVAQFTEDSVGVTSDIPVNTTIFAGHLHIGNRGTAAAVTAGMQCMGWRHA